MTKEEILAMEAGEELDRLVATEVMGEPMPEFTPENALDLQLAGRPVKSPKGNWLCLCRYEECDIPTWRPLPYSTDIPAAWPVVEAMRDMEDGHGSPLLCCLTIYGGHVAWDITWRYSVLGDRNDGHKEHRLPTSYEKLPEAICKAALLARLDEIEKMRGKMIDQVIRFQNGIVLVFDENGEQMPAYQRRYEEVRAKILAHAPKSAKFFHGIWGVSSNAVPRKDW